MLGSLKHVPDPRYAEDSHGPAENRKAHLAKRQELHLVALGSGKTSPKTPSPGLALQLVASKLHLVSS